MSPCTSDRPPTRTGREPRALGARYRDLRRHWQRHGTHLHGLVQRVAERAREKGGARGAERLARAAVPAERLAVAATIVRHLTTDPLLPAVLCPPHWPGGLLRAAYADYQHELRITAQLG